MKKSKKLKRLMAVILAVSMMFSVFTITSFAATEDEANSQVLGESYTSGDFEYNVLDDDTAIITEYTGKSTDVEIPSEINGYTVTSIGGSAFSGCTSLKNVTIPNSVTSIGYSAFKGCANLASITIPESVISIGRYAFYDTAWYDNQPDGVVYAGKVVYEYNGEMPENTVIILKEETKGIADGAFDLETNLSSVTIPNSVTNIGASAFSGCTSLVNITIPDSVTSISDYAFSKCTSLERVTIPEGVTEIGWMAFYECYSLKNVTIPESIISIEYCAFEDCSSLENIFIPASVTEIGDFALIGCTSLDSIDVDSNNTKYTSVDGILFDENMETLICYPPNKSDLRYEIPQSVTCIDYGAFYNSDNLTEIIISKNVKTMEGEAFSGCDNLTSVIIEEGVTAIGYGAFRDCINLEKIIIPDSVREIYAWGDSDLYSGGFNGVYSQVFYRTKWYDNQPDGVVYAGKVAYCYKGEMPENTEIALKPGTVAIADNAFAWQKNLISIDIPDGVTTIGGSAFAFCENLNDISLPDSVTKIRKNAMAMGYAFKNTGWYDNQPDGLVYIGDILFTYKGENLEDTDLVIKNGTKTIADSAFLFCDNFNNIKSVTIPASVTTIGDAIVNHETIVYGYTGTAAETYANENELTFISMGTAVVTGDTNGDNEVNAKDRMMLTRYLAKWSGYENIDMTAADVNSDNEVNAKDRMILTRHLAKWSGYETLPYTK